MNDNSRRIVSRRTFWCLCLAAGLLFLGAVFLLSRHADMQDCERRMTELIDFVKEQSSSYVQYNETAVAKALVRETTAVQELDGVTLDCGEDELRKYVERAGADRYFSAGRERQAGLRVQRGQHRLYPPANRSGSRARALP